MEQNNDTKIGPEPGNYENSDNEDVAGMDILFWNGYEIQNPGPVQPLLLLITDEADIKSDDGQHETPHESNSNNLQSPLSADMKEFREDNESSFFSYFMFLMFVIITFYVAYHNKSKILALLIEGRRGRTYSSRGGSRRKSHSAEYRKLDCNLEEAIQSGGSKTLSTQIIY